MKISAKVEYACIAMLELAAGHSRGEPIRIGQIADRHGIPARFLVQILLQLKGAGLVGSTRGASGGYQLSRSPETISLYEVMAAVEGQEGGLSTGSAPDSAAARVLLETWRQVASVEREMLEDVSLADLTSRAGKYAAEMYHI